MARYSFVNQFKIQHDLVFQESSSLEPNYTPFRCIVPQKLSFVRKRLTILKNKPPYSKLIVRECMNSSNEFPDEESINYDDWRDEEDGYIEDLESPWEGAVMYERDPLISHLEYCTTLERLGLGRLSTEVSRSRASLMGLRVTKSVKDFPLGTPVLISIDVTRKKQKLRLDGILRTVITLHCYRCGKPAAECLFSNFSLLLTEEPIEEPETLDMEVIFGEDKLQPPTSGEGEEDDDVSIDSEDWIYFPHEEKVIDISKHIRDIVHLEITLDALCDPMCKGLCLTCGTNLNTGSCNCSKQNAKEKAFDRLGDLKEQMQK